MLEEAGYHAAPLPLAEVAACAIVLERFGTPDQRQLLHQIVSGDLVLTLCHQEGDGRWLAGGTRTIARRDDDSLVIDGSKAFVDFIRMSGKCLVVCSLADAAGTRVVVLIDSDSPGVEYTDLISTAKNSHSLVTFNGVRVPASNVIGTLQTAETVVRDLLDFITIFTCCQMAGAADRAATTAFEHARNREAFGQPIGAFQSIQHTCADMIISVDGAKLLAREALWRLSTGLPAQAQISQAKSFANEHCLRTCRSAQQIHGGMGFMMEFDLHLWYRRVTSWSLRAGTTSEHRKRLSSFLLDVPGKVRLDRFEQSNQSPIYL